MTGIDVSTSIDLTKANVKFDVGYTVATQYFIRIGTQHYIWLTTEQIEALNNVLEKYLNPKEDHNEHNVEQVGA